MDEAAQKMFDSLEVPYKDIYLQIYSRLSPESQRLMLVNMHLSRSLPEHSFLAGIDPSEFS